MKRKVNALMILAMCGMLSGCTGAKYGVVEGSPYELLNGRTSKLTYESLTVTGVGSLNYLVSSEAADAGHFANFVDGLVTHNEFGILVLNLAESAKVNEDSTQFEFKIRSDKNLYWSTYKGQPYKYNGEIQYVKAEDFVSAAKAVLTFSRGSKTAYMYTDFVAGCAEYYLYTEVLNIIATKGTGWKTYKDNPAKQAEFINTGLEETYPNVYTASHYDEHPVTAADIPSIANGSRLGVVADANKNTVTYNLVSPAFYFPTMLSYSPFMPVNQHFLEEKNAAFGKASCDSILYCGPYYMSKLDDTSIIYKKNQAYHKRADLKSFMTARVDTIKYNLVKADIDEVYIRNQFEKGRIDGFSLSMNDKEGWKIYVTGPNGEGTIENPVNGLVNSRLLDTVGSCYGSNIVMERTSSSASAKSYYKLGTEESVANTEKALRLQDVRKAIMMAFDYPMYFKRNSDGDPNSVFAKQNLVHTYVPKNFVYDDEGNEYTDTYYAHALAEYKGISDEQARALIEVGQFDTRQSTAEEVYTQTLKAVAAIEAFNASEYAVEDGPISLPVNIEYFSTWFDQKSSMYDGLEIESMNKRLNNVTSVAKDLSNLPYFKVVPTDDVTSKNNEKASGYEGGHAAFDFAPVQWGWGADYGDPLTYMNTYINGGDWSGVFDFIGSKNIPNYKWDGTSLTYEQNLLADYTALVKQGASKTENMTERFSIFAEAEVMLIEELAIYKPQVNYGQGWSLSVSKSAGYEMPSANYGLSNDRLTGMWILKEPLTREERTSIRTQFETARDEYKKTHPAIDIYGE